MGAKTSYDGKNSAELADKFIYIVGPQRLQNELMASFLERETGAKCDGCENIGRIPDTDDEDKGQSRLVLWDCLGKELDSCMLDFEFLRRGMVPCDCVALFNVCKGLGIEERAMVQEIRGFFYEDDPLEQYPKGVRAIFNGELWASRELMTKFIQEEKRHRDLSKKHAAILTQREIEILSMVAVGAKNEEIADSLCISPNTVKTHVYNIFKKINVPNRLQAALWAAKNL